MTDQQITALAREYAEERIKKKGLVGKDANMLFEAICSNIEKFLPWLLRRYCLVEKEKVRVIRWRKVYNAEDIRSKFTEECLIDALFPDLGKEVEE